MKKLTFFLILIISTTAFGQTTVKDSSVLEDKFIRQNLIGKWKDQNSTTTFKKNGTYSTTFDDSLVEYGKWSVEKNTLSFRGEIMDSFGSYFTAYTILLFTPTKMEYQLIDTQSNNTIWIAFKIVTKGK